MGLAAKDPLSQYGSFWSTHPDRLLQRHSHPHPNAPTHEALAPHPSPVAPLQGIRLAAGATLGIPVLPSIGARLPWCCYSSYRSTPDFRPGSFSVLSPLTPTGP